MRTLTYLALASIVLMPVTDAFAKPYFEAIDMGVPRNGSTVMTGYHGYVIRAVSDEGRIQALDIGNYTGDLGIGFGNVAQRWEDPTASGHHYTDRSPGPFAANNTFDSDLNFDSHFFYDPATVVLQPIRGEPSSPTTMTATYEYAREMITSDNAFAPPGYMPLQSSPSVLYFVGSSGLLLGNFAIQDAARANSFDFAYVVSNTFFTVQGDIAIENGTTYGVRNTFVVPEPAMLSSILILLLVGSQSRGVRATHEFRA